MNLDQMRDRLAELTGWKYVEFAESLGGGEWRKYTMDWPGIRGPTPIASQQEHPIPLTLDGIVALYPKNWDWRRYGGSWMGFQEPILNEHHFRKVIFPLINESNEPGE